MNEANRATGQSGTALLQFLERRMDNVFTAPVLQHQEGLPAN
jgi:ribosomal protein S4